ncbi:MAG: hypothetical protein ACPGXZ_05320 [Saprospiraceae bacterium]
MERDYIEKNDVIEQYLLERLSNEERKAFSATLQFDEELRQEVEDTRLLLYQKEVLPLHNEDFLKREWLLTLALLILILAYLFVYKNG